MRRACTASDVRPNLRRLSSCKCLDCRLEERLHKSLSKTLKSLGTKANKVAATDCRLEERLCKTLSKNMKSTGTKANKVAAPDPSSAVPGLSVAALSGSNPDRLGTGNMQAEEQDGPIGGNTKSSHAQGIIPVSDCGWVFSGVPAGVSVRSKDRRDAVSAISVAYIHGSRDVGLFPASSCAPCRHDV